MAVHLTLEVHECDGEDGGIVRVEEREKQTHGGVSPGVTKFAVAYRSGAGTLRGRDE